jgi:hypothetical protein
LTVVVSFGVAGALTEVVPGSLTVVVGSLTVVVGSFTVVESLTLVTLTLDVGSPTVVVVKIVGIPPAARAQPTQSPTTNRSTRAAAGFMSL